MNTNELFSDFLECTYRVYLKLAGATGKKSEHENLHSQLAQAYHTKVRDHLLRVYSGKEVCTDAPLAVVLAKRFDLAIDVTATDGDLPVHFDALIASPGETSPNRPRYIPVIFAPGEKVRKDDKLQLALCASVLLREQGSTPLIGRIVHGSRFMSSIVHVNQLLATVASVTKQLRALKRATDPPPLHLNPHCPACEFKEHCGSIAIERDDLSLLRGIEPKELLKLRKRGIFTVTQLSYTFRPRRRSKRSKTPLRYYHSLKALALRDKKIYVVGNPTLNMTGTPVYLDVEGIPDQDFYYLIGIRVPGDGCYVQRSFWAQDAAGEEAIWRQFLDVLATIENPRLFHYGSYETAFLTRMKKRYERPTEDGSVVDVLVAGAQNVLSVIYAQIYFPTHSNGLKDIASFLGFKWSTPDPSGSRSVLLRQKWELPGSPTINQDLIAYNADDCTALELVVRAVLQVIPNDGPLSTLLPESNAVHVDSMKPQRPYNWGPVEFVLPELDWINKCAYWEYQRDRIYIRSNPRLRRVARRRQHSKGRSLPVNKTVSPSKRWKCPKCDSREIGINGKHRKLLYDLRFGNGGVKRWVTEYIIDHYKCRKCGNPFPSDEIEWTRHRYGLQLLAYVIHNIIELHLPQLKLAGSIHKLFGYSLGQPTINGLKQRASVLYNDAYEEIKERLQQGKLIHADETHLGTKGIAGYVWVFTSMEEVAYVWSATREGSVAQEFLRNFKGVLVSDFYSAYDSIDCAQQRCLIHLIRDLNDDVLSEAFNEEMQALVRGFTSLLKPIIDTIDRFGLKTHFLKRHRTDVKKFYEELLAREYKTELAQKAQERFRKNRGRLFTFLDHDDVPWNNNNAEHAIKAFAGLRRVIDGYSNECGVSEYLVLLSICQTCVYRGLDFLDFLRSGEKRIDEYVRKGAGRGRSKGPGVLRSNRSKP